MIYMIYLISYLTRIPFQPNVSLLRDEVDAITTTVNTHDNDIALLQNLVLTSNVSK